MRQNLFGRKQNSTQSSGQSSAQSAGTVVNGKPVDPQSGKGRPTPSRKEAQAAARERARAAANPKGAKRNKSDRQSAQAKMREAMRTGDERYLPERDKGPVKRFVRDFIDSRFTFSQFLLPMLFAIMILSYSSNPGAKTIGSYLWGLTVVVVVIEVGFTMWRMRRALAEKLPKESPRGAMFYGVLRMVQLRFLRMPKPQVRPGGKPINR